TIAVRLRVTRQHWRLRPPAAARGPPGLSGHRHAAAGMDDAARGAAGARVMFGLTMAVLPREVNWWALNWWLRHPSPDGTAATTRLLECLALVLPSGERSRFVDEAQGNLGDCGHWWQRADQLAGL